MNIVDPNQDQGDTEEVVIPKAPEVDADGNPIAPKAPSSDPLDAIEDEVVRNDMKRLRAIDQRAKKRKSEEQAPQDDDTAVPPSTFATKDDLKLLATKEAKKLVAPEVKELWDELTAIPLGGYDPMDAESIATNMAKRLALYRIDNPAKDDDPTKDLKTSPDTTTSKGKVLKKTETKSAPLPGYKEPAQPADWYPEK